MVMVNIHRQKLLNHDKSIGIRDMHRGKIRVRSKNPFYLFVMKNRRRRRTNGNNRREKRTPTAKYKTSVLLRDLRVLLLVGGLNSFTPLTPERLRLRFRYDIPLILFNTSIVSLYTERSEIHYGFVTY